MHSTANSFKSNSSSLISWRIFIPLDYPRNGNFKIRDYKFMICLEMIEEL